MMECNTTDVRLNSRRRGGSSPGEQTTSGSDDEVNQRGTPVGFDLLILVNISA